MKTSKNMRKICAIICLALVFLFSAVACNHPSTDNGDSTSGSDVTSATVAETAESGSTTDGGETATATTAATTASPDPMEFESGIGDGGAETGDGWKS